MGLYPKNGLPADIGPWYDTVEVLDQFHIDETSENSSLTPGWKHPVTNVAHCRKNNLHTQNHRDCHLYHRTQIPRGDFF
jgi:hypothetical protein